MNMKLKVFHGFMSVLQALPPPEGICTLT